MIYLDIGWTCGGVAHCLLITQIIEQLECSTSDNLGDIYEFRKTYHSSTSTQHPGMSLHVISFTRPSLAWTSTASKKRWVRRPRYEASKTPLHYSLPLIPQRSPTLSYPSCPPSPSHPEAAWTGSEVQGTEEGRKTGYVPQQKEEEECQQRQEATTFQEKTMAIIILHHKHTQ